MMILLFSDNIEIREDILYDLLNFDDPIDLSHEGEHQHIFEVLKIEIRFKLISQVVFYSKELKNCSFNIKVGNSKELLDGKHEALLRYYVIKKVERELNKNNEHPIADILSISTNVEPLIILITNFFYSKSNFYEFLTEKLEASISDNPAGIKNIYMELLIYIVNSNLSIIHYNYLVKLYKELKDYEIFKYLPNAYNLSEKFNDLVSFENYIMEFNFDTFSKTCIACARLGMIYDIISIPHKPSLLREIYNNSPSLREFLDLKINTLLNGLRSFSVGLSYIKDYENDCIKRNTLLYNDKFTNQLKNECHKVVAKYLMKDMKRMHIGTIIQKYLYISSENWKKVLNNISDMPDAFINEIIELSQNINNDTNKIDHNCHSYLKILEPLLNKFKIKTEFDYKEVIRNVVKK